MSVQFNTIGFINFNKDYNKALNSGAITVSFTSSTKNKDGNYETQYFNGLIPAKLVSKIKPLINKDLCNISGVINPTKKGYVNFTILQAEKYEVKKEDKSITFDISNDDMPF